MPEYCPICLIEFGTTGLALVHQRMYNHSVCFQCHRRFCWFESLLIHFVREHIYDYTADSGTRLYCTECHADFLKWHEFEVHMSFYHTYIWYNLFAWNEENRFFPLQRFPKKLMVSVQRKHLKQINGSLVKDTGNFLSGGKAQWMPNSYVDVEPESELLLQEATVHCF
ncbi:zinc finger C2H2 type [Echinococcus multilocularis]|uniref:Zinc finger C2H2 type n=1 Tax=Echinococcus multilocularis TaxID=6211 RepID=A0A068XX64_ECHMU|nr:zinc finger C2H2 type [Echinococcus multilocularis]